MTKSLQFLTPLVFFLLLAAFLWHGLDVDPRKLPSALLNKPAPELNMPQLQDSSKSFTNEQLRGRVSMLHIWSSWCEVCREEHPIIMDISRSKVLPIYGLVYKDDADKAKAVLRKYGNPYNAVAFDEEGKAAIDWGVYGVPETYIIDAKGVIRYKQLGAITPRIWKGIMLPLIHKLQEETKRSSSR
ncbi:DsbE family thiol:disulfide interchange protein [soil metagenome]